MNEFSPSIINDLDALFSIIQANAGNRDTLNEAIAASFPRLAATPSTEQRLKRARNVLIGMSECDLFDLSSNLLTPRGQALAAIASTASRIREFSKHLLNNCGGSDVLEVARMLAAKGEPRSKDNINRQLRQRGFIVTTNEGNASKLRLWLEKSGVIRPDWSIDEAVFEQLTGASDALRQEWLDLGRAQRAVLTTLRDANPGPTPSWHSGAAIKQLCIQKFGPEVLPEGALRAKVLKPLEATGWIETRITGRQGRGGKIGDWRPTSKLLGVPGTFDATRVRGLTRAVLRHLAVPLADLKAQLRSGSINEKGLALETFAVHLALFAGLEPLDVRLRNVRTGRAEVDVLAEGQHLLFSRWIFQCKNTPGQSLRLPDLAREIGMAALLNGQVVVMVTTGRIGVGLKRMADGYEATTSLQIILLDGTHVDRVLAGGATIFQDQLRDQAKAALTLKRSQVAEGLGGSDDE